MISKKNVLMYLDFLENRIKSKKEVSTLTYDQTPLKTDIHPGLSWWFFALSTKDLQPH